MKQQTFAERELIRGDRKVVLEYIGEGGSGDYDPEDPNDEPLLRFTVYERHGSDWDAAEAMQDASYCTNLPTSISDAEAMQALDVIMRETEGKPSIKRICEQLSHLSPADLRRDRENAGPLVDQAIAHLRQARDLLKQAKAPKAVHRVRLALSSAAGARRNAELKPYRQGRSCRSTSQS